VRSQLEESLVSFFANAGMIEVAVLVGGALTIMICLVYAIGRFRKTRLMVSAGKSSWFHRTLNLSRPQSRLDDGGGAK
jgi:hypothetical protein